SVAFADFGCVHVAAEFGWDNRAARFAIRGSDTDAAQERMEREAHLEIRIERLKGRDIFLDVDRVKPDLLRQWLGFEHGCVMGGVSGAETRAEGSDALFGVNLQVQHTDDERIAWFRSVDVERAGQGIVALDQRKRIARLLQSVAEAIQ